MPCCARRAWHWVCAAAAWPFLMMAVGPSVFTRAGQPLRHFRLQLWARQDLRGRARLMVVASGFTPCTLPARRWIQKSCPRSCFKSGVCARLPSSLTPFVTSIMRRLMQRWRCVRRTVWHRTRLNPLRYCSISGSLAL